MNKKVGGLPLPELNQLELQFLLLNDFRLVISSEEMQKYAEQLILFSRSSALMSGAGIDGGGMVSVSSAPVGTAAATTPAVAAPMSAMGAIDAYGGRVADETYRTRSALPSDMAVEAPVAIHTRHEEDDDTETEDGDEASTGTTDDEPTIKAASVADRGRRRESIDEAMVETPVDSERTPERRQAADERMTSP